MKDNPASGSGWPSNRPANSATDAARLAESDRAAGFEIADDFEPFTQRNDLFNRAFWDPSIATDHAKGFFNSYRMRSIPRRGDGFTQKDFALRNAAWSLADSIADRSMADGVREGFLDPLQPHGERAPEQVPVDNPQAMGQEIKRIAQLFGADIAGVTAFDPRWLYASRVDCRDFSEKPNDLPPGLTSVIVLGHGMDLNLVDTYPSALAGTAVGLGYSGEAATALKLANYIHNLGYEAVASMNDTALVIPLAIKAGLGEYGRNQMVMTEEFGPRVRFSKIFTDLPLTHDGPKRFGVSEFCAICRRCADACPVSALPLGPPTDAGPNQSSIKGVKKWTADCEKCFGYWTKLKSDCAICLRVCPYNKDFSRPVMRLARRLAGTRLRKAILWLDTALGHGGRSTPKAWWQRLASNSRN